MLKLEDWTGLNLKKLYLYFEQCFQYRFTLSRAIAFHIIHYYFNQERTNIVNAKNLRNLNSLLFKKDVPPFPSIHTNTHRNVFKKTCSEPRRETSEERLLKAHSRVLHHSWIAEESKSGNPNLSLHSSYSVKNLYESLWKVWIFIRNNKK